MATGYTPPSLTSLPSLPPVPGGDFGQSGRPNLADEADLQRQWDALDAIYNPNRQLAKENLKAALQPYGDMWTFDDTGAGEGLGVSYNPNGHPGQLYRDAYRGVKGAMAARGLISSSYADRSLGDEAAKISAQAQKMVNQYATNMNDSFTAELKDRNSIISQIMKDYGADSTWLADQVPPAPPIRPGQGGIMTWKEWLGYNHITNANAATADRWRKYVVAHGGVVQAPIPQAATAAPPAAAPPLPKAAAKVNPGQVWVSGMKVAGSRR